MNSPYAVNDFQPDSSGLPRFAAISHATLARGKSNNKAAKGVLTSFSKGLSHKTNAKAEEKDVKTPSQLFTNRLPRAKVAWLIAAKGGEPCERG